RVAVFLQPRHRTRPGAGGRNSAASSEAGSTGEGRCCLLSLGKELAMRTLNTDEVKLVYGGWSQSGGCRPKHCGSKHGGSKHASKHGGSKCGSGKPKAHSASKGSSKGKCHS